MNRLVEGKESCKPVGAALHRGVQEPVHSGGACGSLGSQHERCVDGAVK